MKTSIFKKEILFWFFLIFLISYSGTFSQNVGSATYIQVNDIYLPFNNRGVIADVNVPPNGSQGQFAGGNFLFSSGFWLSGYTNSTLWANGVASSSGGVQNYQAGTVGMDPNDPKASIYRVSVNDPHFGQSWQDWIDAVELGADFYDGDGDGIYNPVDKNGNGIWDPDEDAPDLFLDETYWCVFNDGVPANQRRWQSHPQGIEIRQTIFAASVAGAMSNAVFVRYRIKNTGTIADTLEDVYFSMWADGDIGDHTDDVFGSDTLRQSIYFYNNTPDAIYGNEVPSFMMDMLTGPYAYIIGETFIDINGNGTYEHGIDTPLDTAISYRGLLGIVIYPGAKNLELNSAVFHIGGDPEIRLPNDVTEVRNFVLGLNRVGQVVDPCNWYYGEVRGGIPCNEVNPYYWVSGDPVTDVGWICTENIDLYGTSSTGPFTLAKDEEVEVLIGYEIDRSTTPLGGITAVRAISDAVQIIYENNFGYPIVSVEDEKPIATNFRLEQNYPNPFNPSTKISWQSPIGSWQTLKVYDLLGREIATLVDEYKPAGKYEINFDFNDLASGVYIYQLRVNDFITSKKMMLIR